MNITNKELIEEYQCPGCVCGSDVTCGKYKKSDTLACGGHCAGTTVSGIGRIFLGMPKGFNRLGPDKDLTIWIYDNIKDFTYDKFNIPVWKYKNSNGHIFVRGIMPRLNQAFLQIFKSGNFINIDAYEVTDEFLKTIY